MCEPDQRQNPDSGVFTDNAWRVNVSIITEAMLIRGTEAGYISACTTHSRFPLY